MMPCETCSPDTPCGSTRNMSERDIPARHCLCAAIVEVPKYHNLVTFDSIILGRLGVAGGSLVVPARLALLLQTKKDWRLWLNMSENEIATIVGAGGRTVRPSVWMTAI